jgi:hypothetical protein
VRLLFRFLSRLFQRLLPFFRSFLCLFPRLLPLLSRFLGCLHLCFLCGVSFPSALAGEADGEEDAGALGEAVCDEGLAGPWSGPVPTVTSTALPRSASVPAAGF